MHQMPPCPALSRCATIHPDRKQLAVFLARRLQVLVAAVPKARRSILDWHLGLTEERVFLLVRCLQCGTPTWIAAGHPSELATWARCPNGCEPGRDGE